MGYYNTLRLSGEDLAEKEKKTESQKERIKNYFYTFNFAEYTSEDLQRLLFGDSVPLTSIRRAVSDLVKENILVYCGKKRGKYNDFINVVKLVKHFEK